MDNRVLVVDDSDANLKVLRELLEPHYTVSCALTGEECLSKLRSFSPDVVLLDIVMPGVDGYEVCRRIKTAPVGQFTQVILVSTFATSQERVVGYAAGADDFLSKPYDHEELLAKLRVQFRLRMSIADLWAANASIQKFNVELENLVAQRTAEVVATRDVAIFGLAKLAESRDPDTGEHLDRIRNYCQILADQLSRHGPYRSEITPQFIEDIYRSSPLHDIGKVGIPDAVLLKPGRLTREEFEIMKRHTVIGAEALLQAVEFSTCGSFLDMAIAIARHHHERFDGKGYPDGIVGYDIPLAARITALADVFDALTTARVYKPAYAPDVARHMIEEEVGNHFDPVVVEAFQDRYRDFICVYEATRSPDLVPPDSLAMELQR